jgi:hypothetical protein
MKGRGWSSKSNKDKCDVTYVEFKANHMARKFKGLKKPMEALDTHGTMLLFADDCQVHWLRSVKNVPREFETKYFSPFYFIFFTAFSWKYVEISLVQNIFN